MAPAPAPAPAPIVVSPSGFTFAQFLQMGLFPLSLAVSLRSGFSSDRSTALSALVTNRLRPSDVNNLVTAFQSGEPVDLRDFAARLDSVAAAYLAFGQAVQDVRGLALANPGEIVSVGASPNGDRPYRGVQRCW